MHDQGVNFEVKLIGNPFDSNCLVLHLGMPHTSLLACHRIDTGLEEVAMTCFSEVHGYQ